MNQSATTSADEAIRRAASGAGWDALRDIPFADAMAAWDRYSQPFTTAPGTVTFTLSGASDDLVEVALDGQAEEYGPGSSDRWQADLVAPGATEQMRVHCWYDSDGCWQVGVGQTIEDVPLPAWPLTITQAPAMNPANPGYSALLTIDVPEGTRLDNIKPEPEH